MPRALCATGPKSSPTFLLLQKSLGRGARSHESTAAAVLVSKHGSHLLLPGMLFQESRILRI